MDIVGLARAQMLSALFAALDQPVAGLVKAGSKAEARVVSAPDPDGVMTVSIRGAIIPLSIKPEPAPAYAARAAGQPALATQAEEIGAVLRPGQLLSAELSEDGQSVVLRPLPQPSGALQAGLLRPSAPFQPPVVARVLPDPAVLENSAELADASLRQQPLGKVLGSISSSISAQPEAAGLLPQSARVAINRLFAAQVDGDRPVSPKSLREVLTLLTGGPRADRAETSAPITAIQMKALFQALKTALEPILPEATRQGTTPEAKPDSQPRAALDQPASQPVRRMDMPMASTPDDLVQTVFKAAEAGEARISQSQALLRAEALQPEALRSEQRPILALELPIALRGDSFVADFRLDEEGSGAESPEGRIWQARFSVELPSAGTVHARAGLRGDSVSATLWAEEADTALSMRAAADELKAALSEQGLLVLDLRVLHGRPSHRPGGTAGQFLRGAA